MLPDERGSLWIPSIGVQQELWCSIKNVCMCKCEMERGGERREEGVKRGGGRRQAKSLEEEITQCNAQTHSSIIKASNMWSKDNFSCAGAQNDCTERIRHDELRSLWEHPWCPGGKLRRSGRRENWEVELFWLTHASTPATAAESTQWQIVKHIIAG